MLGVFFYSVFSTTCFLLFVCLFFSSFKSYRSSHIRMSDVDLLRNITEKILDACLSQIKDCFSSATVASGQLLRMRYVG